MARFHTSRDDLEQEQLLQLRNLLSELVPGNAYYTRKFQQAHFEPKVESLKDFSLRFPMTTKRELVEDQQANPPYGTNLTYALEQYTRCHQTSGTAGHPLRWLDTPQSWQSLLDTWTEVYRTAGVGATDRIFFAFSFGPFLGFWTAFEAAKDIGCLCLPGGGLSSVARLRAILDHQATVLCCTPTYAIRLAEVARQETIDLSKARIRLILVAGEPGGSIPATRQQVESAWNGARLFDHHGMTEVGPVTYECPVEKGVLHISERAYLPEVIHPETGTPVPAGRQGELLLTTLRRIASPLLRYRTGDLVQARPSGEPCRCGRFDLALEGGILGRTDDMVVVRGVNLYPSAMEAVLRSIPEIAEYQVEVQTSRTLPELELQVELRPDCSRPEEIIRQLESQLQAAFSLRVPVRKMEPGTLPRFELKARRWHIKDR